MQAEIMEREGDFDESSPLIAHHSSPPANRGIDHQRRVLFVAYLVIICVMFGDCVQLSPRIEVYETILCDQYYSKIDTHLMQGRNCKVKAVQQELATLRGVERLTELIPRSAVLAIPYGIAAKKYGHRTILTLALLGIALAETWGLFVCEHTTVFPKHSTVVRYAPANIQPGWFSEFLPIRLIWARWGWQLLGGGSSVTATMFFLILADVTPVESRTIVFFRVHAAVMVAGILAPISASYLMGHNVWLPWVLGEVLIFISVPLTLLLPNRKDESSPEDDLNDAGGLQSRQNGDIATMHKGVSMKERVFASVQDITSTSSFLAANVQVVLLLFMAVLIQLGNDSLTLLLFIYVPGRYHWSFARAGYLWSLGAAVQLFLLILLLPLTGHVLLKYFHFSPHAKDRVLVLASSALMATGAMCLGLAPEIGPAVIGIILMSCGAGLLSLVRSLVTLHVSSEDLSVVFSVMSMMIVISAAVGGPLFNETYAAGLRLGRMWYGLPFFIAAGLVALEFVLALFIREKHDTSIIGQGEDDSA
ncbi:hypothetical protein MMC18_005417 [Xylographa bjoerkii]|nr:hypothetical protein [Xylographa bjoerkii]